jgi:hypothetical protein
MSSPISIKLPKHIRMIFKEWALDFKDAGQRFGSSESMQLAKRLSCHATVVSPVFLEWSFLDELLRISVGHIASDYSSVRDEHRRKHLLDLQRESREMVAWLAETLRLPTIYTFGADGSQIVVHESRSPNL